MDYAQLVKQIGKSEADKVLMDIVQKNAPAFRSQPLQDNIANQDIRGMREYDNTYGSASNRSISLREDIGNKSGAALQSMGMDPRTAQRQGRQVGVASEFLPVSGDLVGADEASRAFGRAGNEYNKGNLLNAGIQGTLGSVESLLSVIGMAGITKVPVNIAKNAARKVAKSAMERVSKINKADLDPLGYQNTKMRMPMSEVNPQQKDMGTKLNRIPLTIEDLQGKRVMPMYWDKSTGGTQITGVETPSGLYSKFDTPVDADGGVDFMRGQAAQKDNAIIASKQGIVSTLNNRAAAETARTKGDDINAMTISMANDGADFTKFESETLAEMMKYAPVTKKAAKQFDDEMKIIDPNWIGVQHPDFRFYIGNSKPKVRKAFVKKMDTKPHQEAYFPMPALARIAVTDPTQVALPAGMAGLGIAKLDPSAGFVKNPRYPHSTYNTQGQGTYQGSMEPVPQGLIFRDAWDSMANKRDKRGNLFGDSQKTYALKTQLPTQMIDQQIVDNVMSYIARRQQ